MRILVSSSSPPDRGAGINAYVEQLTDGLSCLGHEVYLYAPQPRNLEFSKSKALKCKWITNVSESDKAIQELYGFIHEHDIQGVINNDNSFVQCLAPALRCPTLSVGHMRNTSVASLACFNHHAIDHIVAISEDMRDVFVTRFGVPTYKVPIVYSGVSSHDRENAVGHGSASKGRLRVVFAGGYKRIKGADLVQGAVRKYSEVWANVDLDWFGSVPASIAANMQRIGGMRFHGYLPRDKFHQYLRDADLLLLPSRLEGCPMTMLEAMSYATVPIASDGFGAMQRLITHCKEGYVCTLGEWEKQATDCISYLQHNRQVLEGMKEACVMRVTKDFNVESMTRRLVELLKSPTVNRSEPTTRIQTLLWHRPVVPGTFKAPLVDRLCIRLGHLRRGRTINLPPARVKLS